MSNGRALVYDSSRLATRVLHATPNGIDRVDLLLARHFSSSQAFDVRALGLGFTKPRLLPRAVLQRVTDRVASAWLEDDEGLGEDETLEAIVARLTGRARDGDGRIVAPRPKRLLNVARMAAQHMPAIGLSPAAAAPRGALYLNATHFPLEWPRHVAWLDARPDVRPVFFIHDMLAIDRPEWFWGREPKLHQKRIALLARRGAAAIVSTACVEADLQTHMRRLGRLDLPVFRLAPPVQPIFSTRSPRDLRLAGAPYFLVCGTIEPRKNLTLLLNVWAELASSLGAATPKLVVVGKRGWKYAQIIATLDDKRLAGHVIEVAGLATPAYKTLLDHCRALLAPSFAEGFGLPVAEARAAGVAVIASDIAAFREQGGANVVYLDPCSIAAWRRAILERIDPPVRTPRVPPRFDGGEARDQGLERLDTFLTSLA